MSLLKPTDIELEELLELQLNVKMMSRRIEEIKELCKKHGSFCTKKYVCAVYMQSRTGLVGLNEMAKTISIDILVAYNLVKTTTFEVVKISEI